MGEVQGVGLRNWIVAEAQNRNLAGWVRNEADGSVGVLLIGGTADAKKETVWLTQGTPLSEIIDICELALDDQDLQWDASTSFQVIA